LFGEITIYNKAFNVRIILKSILPISDEAWECSCLYASTKTRISVPGHADMLTVTITTRAEVVSVDDVTSGGNMAASGMTVE